YLALDTARGRWAALAAWVGVAFSPPLLLYSSLFYPELPGALLAVWAVRRVWRYRGRGEQLSLASVGVACGLLPWLHLRYVPIAAAIGLAAAMVIPPRRGRVVAGLAALALPAAALGGALWFLDWRLFGGVPPVDEYGAVGFERALRGAPGLLFDRQFGLLPYAPLFVLVPLGVAGLWRWVGSVRALAALSPVTVYAAFVACFSYWYGAFSPPARMLVPVVPLLAAPLVVALERWRLARPVYALLLAATSAIAHLLLDVPRLRYNLPTGASAALEYLSAVWRRDVTTWLPSFVAPDSTSYAWTAGACAALVVCYGLVVLPDLRRER
ncbi:MAG TPA: hypothetical protein VFX49_09670, partial [Chloroflexota bacterium]|nr:hypothetical protein [Chloroflexota bacterium]